MKTRREERLAGEFQKEISAIISGALRAKYPELSLIIGITAADVSADIKSADVYVSIFDTDEARRMQSFEIICDNAGFIRRELSKVMRTRTVPELRFRLDQSGEYGEKIDKILSGLDIKKDE